MIDIRRAIEAIVPDARWDFSVPNEGGGELEYSNIKWSDTRSKPLWSEIVAVAAGFAEKDLQAKRERMEVSPLQLRRALREKGVISLVKDWIVASNNEEVEEAWEYATSYRRLDPFILLGIESIEGFTEEFADEVFELASTL